MLNLKTGKHFAEPSARSVQSQMTRREFGKGIASILAAGVAPSVAVGALPRGLGARVGMMGGGGGIISKSLHSSIARNQAAFVCNFSDTISLPITITLWAYFYNLNYNQNACSFVKVGNNSNGVAVGIYDSPAYKTKIAWLTEAKYWTFGNYVSFNSWIHIAMIVKTGTYPYTDALFVNGVLNTNFSSPWGGTEAAFNYPTSQLSICGRSEDTCSSTVCYPKIYQGSLTQEEINADYQSANRKICNPKIIHAWTGNNVEDSTVYDDVGNWNLTMSSRCSIINETPWL